MSEKGHLPSAWSLHIKVISVHSQVSQSAGFICPSFRCLHIMIVIVWLSASDTAEQRVNMAVRPVLLSTCKTPGLHWERGIIQEKYQLSVLPFLFSHHHQKERLHDPCLSAYYRMSWQALHPENALSSTDSKGICDSYLRCRCLHHWANLVRWITLCFHFFIQCSWKKYLHDFSLS